MFFICSTGANESSDPHEKLTEAQSKSMDVYWQARKAYDAKDYRKVMRKLNEALELDPENAAALMRSSMMHSFLGKYETALDELEKARASLRKRGRHDSAERLEIEKRNLEGLLQENAPPSIVLK